MLRSAESIIAMELRNKGNRRIAQLSEESNKLPSGCIQKPNMASQGHLL